MDEAYKAIIDYRGLQTVSGSLPLILLVLLIVGFPFVISGVEDALPNFLFTQVLNDFNSISIIFSLIIFLLFIGGLMNLSRKISVQFKNNTLKIKGMLFSAVFAQNAIEYFQVSEELSHRNTFYWSSRHEQKYYEHRIGKGTVEKVIRIKTTRSKYPLALIGKTSMLTDQIINALKTANIKEIVPQHPV